MKSITPTGFFVLWIAILALSLPPNQTLATGWWDWMTKEDDTPGGRASKLVKGIRYLSLCLFNKDNFDKEKVRLVDTDGHNVIIRMPNPAKDGKFCEDEFFAAIDNVLPQGMAREGSKIIAFNLMHRWFEYEEYSVEKSWFDDHADQGYEFKYYPQLGSLTPITRTPEWLRNPLTEMDNHLFLDSRQVVQDLRSEITNQEDSPKIIVLNCVSGRDRTGFIEGLYRMLYLNESYQTVVRRNQVIAGKAQDYFSRNSLRSASIQMTRRKLEKSKQNLRHAQAIKNLTLQVPQVSPPEEPGQDQKLKQELELARTQKEVNSLSKQLEEILSFDDRDTSHLQRAGTRQGAPSKMIKPE